ncbi:MAG: hypothetical protein PVH88_07610 [Ignavibacteria bacterium]|jgi:hypothetical protein
MSSQEIKTFINHYFDGELNKEKEIFLFTQLSQSEEAREYFKEMNLIKTSIEQSKEAFPEELEQRIFNSIKDKTEKRKSFFKDRNLFAVVSYAFSIILIAVSILLFSELTNYQDKLEKTVSHINEQKQVIDLLMNSLPTVTVTPAYENEVIITPQL